MDKIIHPVLSLNVIGPMGDDTQEFEVGGNSLDTVSVRIGTVILRDDGLSSLYLNNKKLYTSETINRIAEDVLEISKTYTNEAIAGITSFEILFVDELPDVGQTGYIYFVPKGPGGTGYYEWIYVNGSWQNVGDTNFDISDYYTKDQINDMFFKKTGGTISGDVTITGDLNVKTIRAGDACIVLAVDPVTEETTISISGGKICLTGDVRVDGTIYQIGGGIIQCNSFTETE